MPAWLSQNIGTILICAVLIAVFALLIWSLIRDKKKGRASCCGGCAGCAMAGQCHPQVNTADGKSSEDIDKTERNKKSEQE